MNPPTQRQQLVIKVVEDFWISNGYGPSLRDLMSALKIKSPNGIRCSLLALEKKGLLLSNGDARSIRTARIDKHIRSLGATT